jgi:MFS family permease
VWGMTPRSPTNGRARRALPAGIWALGFVSLLMDASSELVHSLLPVFMVSVLGASMVTVGLLEGMAEATASIAKIFSGTLSDRWRTRKPLVLLGYGLGALSKPAFPLASSIAWVFAARFVDRIGKGIRGAPRDALVADITPSHLRGAAFGLRQALDSVGAVVGPGLAVALMWWLADDIRTVLWFAIVPAFLAVVLLAVAVREPDTAAHDPHPVPVTLRDVTALPRRYWLVVGVGMVFTLARFSEAFLVLRAEDVGLPTGQVPLVMVVMSATYALGAYPAGIAADRVGGRALLVWGLAVLVVADLLLAAATVPAQVLAGAACWGVHMALTQGLFSKLVADVATGRLRGTAFGVFHLTTGVALLSASVIAGGLWSRVGPAATFYAGAAFAVLAMVGAINYRTSSK